MSSLDSFIDSLIQKKDKLVQMGVIQTSKNQALLMTYSNNAQARGKKKGKETKNTNLKPKEYQESFDGPSGSRKNKTKCP